MTKTKESVLGLIKTSVELRTLNRMIADAVRSAIDGMSSIPTEFEEFVTALGKQPVPKSTADKIKKYVGKFTSEVDDWDIDTIDDIPGEFVGVLPYINVVLHHPRIIESGVVWTTKEIFDAM